MLFILAHDFLCPRGLILFPTVGMSGEDKNMLYPPPPLSKHGPSQKNNGHTGSLCIAIIR